MSYVDEAFEKMRQKAEVKPGSKEQEQAKTRHAAIREHIETAWDIDRTFLTGSYDRHTKIRPLRDVDIFVVVEDDGDQAQLREGDSGGALIALEAVLDEKYECEIDAPAVRVSFSPDDDVTSFEVTPAFEHDDVGFVIPDGKGGWMRTDPAQHAKLGTAKNAECKDMWVPFVKMVKGWNREVGDLIKPSFLLEVMSLDIVKPPISKYQDELVTFFENARLRIDGPWPDPANLGPDVDRDLTSAQRLDAAEALARAVDVAEEAVELEDEGEESAAVEKWRELFKDRMPRP